MLLFKRSAIMGDIISQVSFSILGPMQSRPVAFPGSSLRINCETSDEVISGMWNNIPQALYI